MNGDGFEIGGYYPGSIGHVVEAHAVYYSEYWGFDVSFESQVAREMGDFFARFDSKISGFWTIREKARFVGSVAIDGENSLKEGARLRWFIVQPEFQGKSSGKYLLKTAIEFCSQVGHNKIFLWTFRGLESARSLYERAGFQLVLEHEVAQWGNVIVEQKFELQLPNTEQERF
ncbi:MAG: GNAT family N-acetyltransferase [Desulfomonilaceae bacterium]